MARSLQTERKGRLETGSVNPYSTSHTPQTSASRAPQDRTSFVYQDSAIQAKSPTEEERRSPQESGAAHVRRKRVKLFLPMQIFVSALMIMQENQAVTRGAVFDQTELLTTLIFATIRMTNKTLSTRNRTSHEARRRR